KTHVIRVHSWPLNALPRRGAGALVQDLLQTIEHLHRGVALADVGIRLALFFNGREEFAILELDSVHRDRHFREVNLVLLTVFQIVIVGHVSAVVADIAEERAERALGVERERGCRWLPMAPS